MRLPRQPGKASAPAASRPEFRRLSTTTSPTAIAAAPAWLTLLLAAACGLIVANIYYVQPLAGPVSASLGLSPQAAGLVVTMTQVGYGAGLLLVVPLADVFENRALVLAAVGLSAAARSPPAARTRARCAHTSASGPTSSSPAP